MEETFPIRSYVVAPSDLSTEIKSAAKNCHEYHSIVKAWKKGMAAKDLPPQHPGRCLQDVWHAISIIEEVLIVVDNTRLVVG